MGVLLTYCLLIVFFINPLNSLLIMKTANTVFGKSSGKLAGVVASSWKGINVVREKALVVANPNTVAQQTQRGKMAFTVASARSILGLLQLSFKEQAVKQSEFNAFVSANISEVAITGGVPSLPDPLKWRIGKGTIPPVPISSVNIISAGEIEIDWDDTPNTPDALPTDNVYCVMYNKDLKLFEWSPVSLPRSSQGGGFTFDVVSAVAGKSYVFIVAVRASAGKASDSTSIAL